MKPAISIIGPGTKVLLGIGDDKEVAGIVRQVSIGADGIEYQCAYWDGNTRNLDWLTEGEVSDACAGPRTVIGFKSSE